MVDPLSYFSFQPVLHDWCNKCHGMLSCLWDGAYKGTLVAISRTSQCTTTGVTKAVMCVILSVG